MRIAYVSTDRGVPAFGQKGSSIHVQSILRAFVAHGATVTLYTTRPGGEPPPDLRSVTVRELPAVRGDASARADAAIDLNDLVTESLDDDGPFDLVYERHALYADAAMLYARGTGTPGMLEVNAPLIDEQSRFRELVRPDDARSASARSYAAAHALLAVSEGVGIWLRGWPEAADRVHVVPNGVDVERFPEDLVPVRPASDDIYTVGFVGTLKPWHGVENLIDAFAQLTESRCRLLLVGDGPQRDGLEARVEKRGVRDRTWFAGSVAPETIPGWIASMDVAVAPYPPMDGFYFSPLKLYEYMAAGRAIVASSVGQVEEVIDHDVTGFLYPPGDVESLAAAIAHLRDDTSRRLRLGAAARVAARSHTWASVIERIASIAGVEFSTVGASQETS